MLSNPVGDGHIRVASVPASHVYVRHLSPPTGDDAVTRLPDPRPADGATVPGGWWPPLMLEPGWVARHHREFDVFHIHFGFDALPPETIAGVANDLARHDKPLVYTLHDLRNPHHPEPGAHEDVLEVLLDAADEIITLTPGAAQEISNRWQRQATVLPHPHVIPPDRFGGRREPHRPFVIGVHAKSVRANMDPLPVIEALLGIAERYDDVVVAINVHDEIFDPDDHWYNPQVGAAIVALGDHPRARLHIHPYFSDDELWSYLASLDVSVLPYRFGTHSGWLEACHDLGTQVIAPSCGYYRQQQRCAVYRHDETTFDADSLAVAVDEVYRSTAYRPSWDHRAEQRAKLAAAHRDLYRQSLNA